METVADLLFIVIGTAVITTLIVTTAAGRTSRRRAPQVLYVSVPEDDESNGGCLPLLALVMLVLGVIWLGM